MSEHTPITSIRIPPLIKAKAKARAAAEGKTLTDEVVAYLAAYGDGEPAVVHRETLGG